MKGLLRSLLVAFVFTLGLGLTACDDATNSPSDTQEVAKDSIKKISVAPSSVPAQISTDKLEEGITSMKLKVYYNDGSIKEIPVTKDMVDPNEWESLESADGPVRITLKYKGFETKVSIKMVLKLEVNMDGTKLQFNDKDIKSCLLGGDTIPTAEEADMYVWGWKVDENGKDDESVKGKFFPVADNVCYIDEVCNKCLVVYMTKGASADWDNKIDQTADLSILNGKVIYPNGAPVGKDIEFTINLDYCKKNLESGEVSDDLAPFAYVSGGVVSNYFTPIADGVFTADSLTTNLVVYYMPQGTTADTAKIEDAKAKTKPLAVGFNTPEGSSKVESLIFVARDVNVKLKSLSFMHDNKPASMPEKGQAYIYAYVNGDAGSKVTNIFTTATISEGVIKASIPMDCDRAIVVFMKPGSEPTWGNYTVQTTNLVVGADGSLAVEA